MAEKLDYTIQIDGDQYDVTAADSLHADLANQVEKALIVKKSVRKGLKSTTNENGLDKNDKSLALRDLKDAIEAPSTAVGVDVVKDANGNPTTTTIPITRTAKNAFAFKGDSEAEIEVVPSSGGVFTGPIYAPDINAGDGFNINKFQITNYNSVDTLIRELKGFPVYEWKSTSDPQVEALTAVTLKESEDGPPTMLPFKVVIYKTGGFWNTNNLKKLKFTNCATACNFLIINADKNDTNGEYGRTLLGTYTPNESPLCTYVDLRVAEADHADNATNVTDSIGSMSLKDIFVYNDSGIITPQVKNAANADVAGKLGTADKGDQTHPIYLDNGVATPCLQYAGGTLVKLNGQIEQAQTAELYAPTNAGTDGYFLVSSGTGEPAWEDPNDLSVKYATEAGSATTVTTYIKNQSITDIFKTATGGISTVVKNADTATKADKLYIYNAGGVADAGSRATAFSAKHDSYIIYGDLNPPTSPKTGAGANLPNNDDLLKEGNIYIKIEP